MNKRLYTLVSIISIFVMVFSLARPNLAQAQTISQSTAEISAPELTAVAHKTEAIRLVESMQYPNPDITPPGKELRKEYILIELRSSIDGTYKSDNFLKDGSAFEHDINAGKRLQNLMADPKVDQTVKELAKVALEHIYIADRMVTAKAIEALTIFGSNIPKDGAVNVKRAKAELAKGDDKKSKGQLLDAIHDYQKAWEYATVAVKLIWAAQDPDNDEVIDSLEEKLGSNPQMKDTDGDGLSDGIEFTLTGTDPTKYDTYGLGTSDGLADLDNDGLSNLDEVSLGTNPLKADSDEEGLSDYFEVREYGTDPLKKDTDDDGLTDDSEYRLGTNPRNPDTDGDGIWDGLEVYTSVAAGANQDVVVEMVGMGDVARTVHIREVSADTRLQGLPGLLSVPVEVTNNSAFENARVKIRFDPAQVPNGDYAGLRVLYYDEGAQVFMPLDTYGIDLASGYAWADTSHFSLFVLFYIPNWQAVWTYPMDIGRDTGDPEIKYLDVLLILDSSGSMSWNDPNGYRKIAAKSYIDALLVGDRVGVVDFDYYARLYQPLTTDFMAAKAVVDRIDFDGGTDIGGGVRLAHQEIFNQGNPQHLYVEILLTDGQGAYDYNLTTQAKNAGIVIYTIGLSSEVNETLLRSIAEGTGGMYFPVASAEDLPQVFKRIIGGGELTDNDKDGVPDQLETRGIRLGSGQIIFTDPTLWDTDGDGLSDGEELGDILQAPWGDYYQGISDPTSMDTDNDGLSDADEAEIGTSPYLADSDGDGLSDLTEIENDFDPNNENPDGDQRNDLEEFNKGSDPFYKDPTSLQYAEWAVEGAVLGEFGENFANLGLISTEVIRSFPYLAGWLAIGWFPLTDIRDVIASLLRLDLVDTLLNAIGIIPLLGDGADAVKTVAKWLGKSDDLIIPATRWAAKTFDQNRVAMKAILGSVGYTDELGTVFSKADDIHDLARARNSGKLLTELIQAGVKFGKRALTNDEWVEVAKRLDDANIWDTAKIADKVSPAYANAKSVEAARQFLARDHDILYVGTNRAVDMLDGTAKHIQWGPDIIAVNRATGETVIVEVKGAVTRLTMNHQHLKTEVVEGAYQTSYDWLYTRAGPRYLDSMRQAADPQVRAAAGKVENILNGVNKYSAKIIGYSPTEAKWGKLDEMIDELRRVPQINSVGVDIITP